MTDWLVMRLLSRESVKICRLVQWCMWTGSVLSHILSNSLLNLLHDIIYIHCIVSFSMLRVFALQVVRVDIQALLWGFHRVILHALFKSISCLFLIRLCLEVRLDYVIVWNRKFTLSHATLDITATRGLCRLCCQASFLDWLNTKTASHSAVRIP